MRTLGLTDADIDTLAERYNTNVREQIRRALLLWAERFKERATRTVLLDALKKSDLKIIADKLDVFTQ